MPPSIEFAISVRRAALIRGSAGNVGGAAVAGSIAGLAAPSRLSIGVRMPEVLKDRSVRLASPPAEGGAVRGREPRLEARRLEAANRRRDMRDHRPDLQPLHRTE